LASSPSTIWHIHILITYTPCSPALSIPKMINHTHGQTVMQLVIHSSNSNLRPQFTPPPFHAPSPARLLSLWITCQRLYESCAFQHRPSSALLIIYATHLNNFGRTTFPNMHWHRHWQPKYFKHLLSPV